MYCWFVARNSSSPFAHNARITADRSPRASWSDARFDVRCITRASISPQVMPYVRQPSILFQAGALNVKATPCSFVISCRLRLHERGCRNLSRL